MRIYEYEDRYFISLRHLIETELFDDDFLDWFDEHYNLMTLLEEYGNTKMTLKEIVNQCKKDFYNYAEDNIYMYGITIIEVDESE